MLSKLLENIHQGLVSLVLHSAVDAHSKLNKIKDHYSHCQDTDTLIISRLISKDQIYVQSTGPLLYLCFVYLPYWSLLKAGV